MEKDFKVIDINKKITGLFLGSAVGDAVGFAREGLPQKRARKIFGAIIRPAFIVIPFLKRLSVCSDDTEHLWITAVALIKTGDKDVEFFERSLSRLMKYWALTFPIGAGKATLKACFKLLLGFSSKKSGVFSAGNGAAMRASAIGAYYAHDFSKMQLALKSSTLMTHTDPKAYEGSLVIAIAASLLIQHTPTIAPTDQFFDKVFSLIKGQELRECLSCAQKNISHNKSLVEFLEDIHIDKKGISGYINHTVLAIIYAWLHHFGDYQKTIEVLITAGGDTDTTAAIAGALAGITAGKENIPHAWSSNIYNYPISISKLEQLADAFVAGKPEAIPKIKLVEMLIRNLCVFPIVLLHGVRRLLPPY